LERAKKGKEQKGRRSPLLPDQKNWLGLFCLLVLTSVSATGVVYSTHKSRHLLNELQNLEQRRNALQVEWGQLLLEQSSLVSQGRIENLAIAELGMKIPDTENVVVVAGE